MKLIFYGGLNLTKFTKYVLKNKNNIFINFDINKNNFNDISNFLINCHFETIIVNFNASFNKNDIDDLVIVAKDLCLYVENLIVTSSNELFIHVLKKYISKHGDVNNIYYAYNDLQSVSENDYLICNSNYPILGDKKGIKKIIIDDRKNGNKGYLFNKFSCLEEPYLITSIPFIKK